MPKLDSIDRWPNIDGHIEIQSDQNSIVGRLFVQAKTLPANHKLKFSCPVTFFSSCDIEPCLLFGVDNRLEKVYWLYFDSHEVKKIDFRNIKHKKTISFDANKYFDKHNLSYINDWTKIVEQNQYRFQNYDKLEKAYEIISQTSNSAVGQTKSDFIKLQLFLDCLNDRLNTEFSIVKNRFYPNTWKLGIAIYAYKQKSVSYALYPVPFGKNDVQIKEVDKNLHDHIQSEGLGFTAHYAENPIEQRSREYALEIVRSKTLKLLHGKLLKHAGSDFLAREFVFAFVDRFHLQMGLMQKNRYSIAEIENAYCAYLPHWLKATYGLLDSKGLNNFGNSVRDGVIRYFDPDRICEIDRDERQVIEKLVEGQMRTKSPIPQIIMGNTHLPIGLFIEFFNFLKQTKVEIERPYKAMDFSRLKASSSWVWNGLSKQDTDSNLRVFFENLSQVYDSIVKNNFPLLERELSLFSKADTTLISWKIRENYQDYQSGPTYELYYLKSDAKEFERTVWNLSDEEKESIKKYDFRKPELKFRGVDFRIIGILNSALDFIYEDTPMLNFVYKELESQVKNYFELEIQRDF